jgi:putative ABC transport system substrate-binding protein
MVKPFRVRFLRSRSANRKSKVQNPKWVGLVAIIVTFAMCGAVAQAQQPKKVPRIGYLTAASLSTIADRTEAFRQGLRELGYVEGKNIVTEYRYAEGKPERLSELAAELVRLKPGGNVTGLSVLEENLSGKRLDILKEAFPKMTRVGYLWNPGAVPYLREPGATTANRSFDQAKAIAQAVALQLRSYEVRTLAEIERAFADMSKARPDALFVQLSPLITLNSKRIVELAFEERKLVLMEYSPVSLRFHDI